MNFKTISPIDRALSFGRRWKVAKKAKVLRLDFLKRESEVSGFSPRQVSRYVFIYTRLGESYLLRFAGTALNRFCPLWKLAVIKERDEREQALRDALPMYVEPPAIKLKALVSHAKR